MMSSPALAALMGLDVAFTLASLIVCNAISPLTAGAFSYVFLGARCSRRSSSASSCL